MKVGIISPIPMLELSNKGAIQMCLAHLCQNPSYKDFYQRHGKKGSHVILDNGAAEGMLIGPKELIELATEINATEVVLPDKLGDLDATLSLCDQFFDEAPSWNGGLIGVLQGRNTTELLHCLTVYNAIEKVSAIGLPRHMNDQDKFARARFVEAHLDQGWSRFKVDQIHALGANSWLREIKGLHDLGVRSMDTCLPISLGLQDHYLVAGTFDEITLKRPKRYFDMSPANDRQKKVIELNVELYIKWGRQEAS
jgi:hypothetical protein